MNMADKYKIWFEKKFLDFLIVFFICFLVPTVWVSVNLTGMPHWIYLRELLIWFRYNWVKWIIYWLAVSLIGLPLLRLIKSKLFDVSRFITKPHIRTLSDSKSSNKEKLDAVSALGENMTFSVAAHLLRAAKNSDADIQKEAVKALHKVKFIQTLKWLMAPLIVCGLFFAAVQLISIIYHRGKTVETLFNARFTLNPEEETKWEAAIALGKLKNRFAVRPLLEILTYQEKSTKEEKEEEERINRYKEEAAETLLGMGSSAYDPLLKILNDKNDDLRGAAATALGEIGNSAIIRPLRKVLKDKKNKYEKNHEKVRSAAAKALGKIEKRRSEAIINVLKALFSRDPEKALSALIGTFGRGSIDIGNAEDVKKAMQHVKDKEDESKKLTIGFAAELREAVERMISREIYDSYNLLETLSKNYENKEIRDDTVIALGKLNDPRAVDPLIEVLKDKDEDEDVRWSAASALGNIGDPGAVDPLIEVFKNKGEDKDVRISVAYALRDIGGPGAVAPLIEALKDEDEDVRWSAAFALGYLGDPGAVASLIEVFKNKDEDKDVRISAVYTLRDIGDPGAVDPLIKALKDEDKYVRRDAASALGDIGDPRAVVPLIEALKDEDVRGSAASALGDLGDPGAVAPLIEVFKNKDEDKDVRISAVSVLGIIGDPRAVDPLIEALENKGENKDVRWSAASALGDIGDPRAVDPLIEALEDKEEGVRRSAAGALGNIGDPGAVDPLIKALKDKGVKSSAASALGNIGDPGAVDPLIEVLEDKDVRWDAVRALGEITDRHFGDDIERWSKWRKENKKRVYEVYEVSEEGG
jgi:HEAT repeat protein